MQLVLQNVSRTPIGCAGSLESAEVNSPDPIPLRSRTGKRVPLQCEHKYRS